MFFVMADLIINLLTNIMINTMINLMTNQRKFRGRNFRVTDF